eukprot:Gb_01210 [translate_table: standard]
MIRSPQEQNAAALPHNERPSAPQFKGVRMRKWGKWVSEVRLPNSRARIWLGSYDTPEKAARAYDAAVYCLRGPKAKFNFPNSPPEIQNASSLSNPQIQEAAARFAREKFPSTSTQSDAAEPASPARSSSVSEAEVSTERPSQICEQQEQVEPVDWASWEALFRDIDGDQCSNLERFPSWDVPMVDIPFPSLEEEHDGFFFSPMDLWNHSN